MENKMTQREYFNLIIALAQESGRDDIVDFCNGRIAQLDKKKSGGGTHKSAVTDENKALVLEVLTSIGSGTCTDIIKASDDLAGYSTQKVRPILTALILEGSVKNEKVKGKSIYSLA